ncbi:MAG: hypothetical protein VKJ64_11180 [Leptolyngbyaceae bacterium]|nr:hypothetical protein [Leptolyngbyaceae bacterium]
MGKPPLHIKLSAAAEQENSVTEPLSPIDPDQIQAPSPIAIHF